MTARDGPGRGWAAGLDRPHVWSCRHCDMVEDYHLERDAQLRRKESLERRDEIDRLVVFKDWLRVYEWESQRLDEDPKPVNQGNDWAADWATEWAAEWATAIPAQRGGTDPVDRARQAVAAVPDPGVPDPGDAEPDAHAPVDDRADEPVMDLAS